MKFKIATLTAVLLLAISGFAQTNSLPPTCTPGGTNDTVTLVSPSGAVSSATPSGLYKCTFPNSYVFVGNTTGNVTVGATPILGSIALTTLSATSTGNLAASALPGMYSLSFYLDQNAACATGTGTVVLTFSWTDDVGARSTANQTLTMTTTPATAAVVQNTFVAFVNAQSNITYTATYTACTTGTGTYSLRATAEKLL